MLGWISVTETYCRVVCVMAIGTRSSLASEGSATNRSHPFVVVVLGNSGQLSRIKPTKLTL